VASQAAARRPTPEADTVIAHGVRPQQRAWRQEADTANDRYSRMAHTGVRRGVPAGGGRGIDNIVSARRPTRGAAAVMVHVGRSSDVEHH
jgi:hypothetical protein